MLCKLHFSIAVPMICLFSHFCITVYGSDAVAVFHRNARKQIAIGMIHSIKNLVNLPSVVVASSVVDSGTVDGSPVVVSNSVVVSTAVEVSMVLVRSVVVSASVVDASSLVVSRVVEKDSVVVTSSVVVISGENEMTVDNKL